MDPEVELSKVRSAPQGKARQGKARQGEAASRMR